MIKAFSPQDSNVSERALEIQHRAYRIEADLIGFEGIPPLHETLEEFRQSTDHFQGYFVEGMLAGFVSYEIVEGVLEILGV